MSKDTDTLPSGWVAGTLSDFAQPRGEKAPPSDFPDAIFLGMDHIEAHTTRIIGQSPARSMKSAAARFYAGDVLYGRLRPYLNKVTVPSFDGLASAEFIVFPDTDLLRSHFLKHRLNAADFVSFASHLNEGDRPRVGFDQIGSFPLRLPPSKEQARIVAKIEELFSELDKGIESLTTVREQLEAYRLSILKLAFEGQFTENWRRQNPTKLETANQLRTRLQHDSDARYRHILQDWSASDKAGRPAKPHPPPPIPAAVEQSAEPFPLPKGWSWVPLSWLLSTSKKPMTTGPFGTMLKKHEHQTSGVPVLGIENIGKAAFVPGNKIFVSQEKSKQLLAFAVEAGDVVISRSGTVGEICEVPAGFGMALISTNLIRISLNPSVIIPAFFVYMFQGGGSVRTQVKDLCKGSSRDFLNQSILEAIKFPLCSLDEQRAILEALSAHMSNVGVLTESIDSEVKRTNALRQSILKKAFSGQLVAQDQKDEPPSALLERIRAEQNGAPARRTRNEKNGQRKNGKKNAA